MRAHSLLQHMPRLNGARRDWATRGLLTLALLAASVVRASAADDTPQFKSVFTIPALELGAQDAAKPAQPSHTGFGALVFETASDFKTFPQRQSTWVILAIGAGAAALGHPADDSTNARLQGDTAGRFFAAGQWIGSTYVLVGTAAGLYLVGRYVIAPTNDTDNTNKVSHLGFDLIRALIVSETLTQGIKLVVRRDRPTGECCAFPSGHSSATFAVASVLERHFGYRGAWPTFAVAAYVATSRLHDDRHFLSDVLFGLALGIASGWTVVGRHGHDAFTLTPTPVPGGIALTVGWTPRAGRVG